MTQSAKTKKKQGEIKYKNIKLTIQVKNTEIRVKHMAGMK